MAQSRVIPAIAVMLVASLRAVCAQVIQWRDAAGQEVARHCQPAQWPKRLPALDAVLDSAALAQAVATPPEGDTTSILFGILYRKNEPATARLLEPAGPPSLGLASLLETVQRLLRPPAAARPLAALRIGFRAGVHRGAGVGRSVYCPPQPMPGPQIGPDRIRVESMPGDRGAPPSGSGAVFIAAESSVDATGQVMDVRLIRGSGLRDLDDQIVRRERERRYLPALVDGLPVPIVVRDGRPVSVP